MGVYSKLANSIVDFGGIKSNPRGDSRVTRITIHHMAGNIDAEDCARMHRDGSVDVSANYYIGSDGSICAGVSEDRRAWTSNSRANDYTAITAEVANNSGEPEWTVSDEAYEALTDLCAEICTRYGIEPHYDGTPNGTLTIHRMFCSTECCGAYLIGKHESGQLERDIRAKMGQDIKPQPTGELYRVQVGAFSHRDNAERMQKKLTDAGYDTYLAITAGGLIRVQVGAFRVKQNAEALLARLQAEGYDDAFITTNPNEGAVPTDTRGKKSLDEIALEVIRGEWGNGDERTEALESAGYDAEEVQARVNELMDR